MRTEVKIGIVVGLVVAVAVVAFFAFRQNAEKTDTPVARTQSPAQPPPPPVYRPVIPSTMPAAATTRPATLAPAEVPARIAATQPSYVPAETLEAARERQRIALLGGGQGGMSPTTAAPTDLPPWQPPARTSPPAQVSRTYTVVAGDNGFWDVSRKVYGDGKHWHLIATANPSANTSALRIGQVLTVPPLPIQSSAGTPSGGGTPGTVRPASSGGREYVVKAGDNGFWGIAESQYGDGKYWKLIQDANPSLDPTALKIGQVVKLPSLPAGTGTPSSPVAPVVRAAPGPGQRVYKVQPGDNGFWGIAEREYGDGAYYPIIAKANPGVDATRLRVGQELVIPSKTEADAAIGAARGTSVGASAASGTGSARPVFD